MGGLHPRYQENSTEFAMGYAESGLEMNYLDVKILDGYLYKYSNQGFVNADQLKYLAKTFGFRLSNNVEHTRIEKFWTAASEDGKYDAEFLHVLAIMLGLGETKIKAELLFELFDRKCEGKLSIGKLQAMLETMIDVVTLLGQLVFNGQTTHSHSIRTESYVSSLECVRHIAIHEILTILLDPHIESHVTKDHFVDKFTQINDGKLLDTVGFRFFLSKFLSKLRFKYTNPFKRSAVKADK